MISVIRDIIEQSQRGNPCEIDVRYNEPMSGHTTFKVGGSADCYVCPHGDNFSAFCAALLQNAQAAEVPVFVLGGGANIVVADKGIRGIVLDTGGYTGIQADSSGLSDPSDSCGDSFSLVFRSGTTIDEAAECAAAAGLSGLEFLAGMPGTIGGAVWMNARCYGKEIADVLAWTEVFRHELARMRTFGTERISTNKNEFNYKKSPFQKMDCLILNAAFNLQPGEKKQIKAEMEKNRLDRKEKGHYLFPCAGSAFKNNRSFGKPTGQIIDELGLRGFSVGGAQVAPFHGNIVINTGNASAADIRSLMNEVAAKVKAAAGFVLEPEILFIGEW